MRNISYARHRFPPNVIQHAVWLYLRFTLSYRDVEDLLAERGLDISYETIRRWVLKFGRLQPPANAILLRHACALSEETGLSCRWAPRNVAG
jgi:putative transposase